MPTNTNADIAQHQKAVARTYLSYHFLSSMFFIGAVWLYFYRLFITDAQVGVLDGIAFAIGLIAEVPSGVLADKYGRGRVARLGLVLTGAGFLIQALGSSFFPFFMGQSIMMVGVSFTSGADEALFFSKINFDRTSVEWRKLAARGSQMALIGTLLATFIGGWLHTINPRIPWFLTGLSFIASSFLLWRLKDSECVREKLSVAEGLKSHLREIRDGFSQFCTKELIRYVPLILTVQALYYTTEWGLLRIVLLDRFHFDPLTGAAIITGCGVGTVVALSLVHRYAEEIREKHLLSMIALSSAGSLLVSVLDIGSWGMGVIFMLYAGDRILFPFLSETLNKLARDEQRATVLSVASFFKVLPYVGIAPLIGALNTHRNLDYFLIVWPILISCALMFYLSKK